MKYLSRAKKPSLFAAILLPSTVTKSVTIEDCPKKICSRDTKLVFGREPQGTDLVGPLRKLLMCNLYRHFVFSANTHAYLLKLHFYKPYLTLSRQ